MRAERRNLLSGARATPLLSSVRNALRVIDTFSSQDPVLGVVEIARRLKISKSAVSRLVTTLCAENILAMTPSGHYRLGVRLYDIGLLAVQSHQLFDAALDALVALRGATGKSAHFSILDDLDVVQVNRLTANDISLLRGAMPRPPAHATSTGKAILAFSTPELIDRAIAGGLRRFTRATISDAGKLRSVLDTVKADGYAFSKDEYVDGVSGISAPILDQSGIAVGALTIIGRTDQMTVPFVKRTAALLIKSAGDVSKQAY
jgi:DNA-binding IclR family transcriptional regulator